MNDKGIEFDGAAGKEVTIKYKSEQKTAGASLENIRPHLWRADRGELSLSIEYAFCYKSSLMCVETKENLLQQII